MGTQALLHIVESLDSMTFPKTMVYKEFDFPIDSRQTVYHYIVCINNKSFIADYISDGTQIQWEYRAIRKKGRLYTMILFCPNRTVSVEIFILELFIQWEQYNPICVSKNIYTLIYLCFVNEQKNIIKQWLPQKSLMRLNFCIYINIHLYTYVNLHICFHF